MILPNAAYSVYKQIHAAYSHILLTSTYRPIYFFYKHTHTHMHVHTCTYTHARALARVQALMLHAILSI